MSRILGLDVGTNSLGWAILDPFQKRFTDAGVVVFSRVFQMKRGGRRNVLPPQNDGHSGLRAA